jgi:hypothetical protein
MCLHSKNLTFSASSSGCLCHLSTTDIAHQCHRLRKADLVNPQVKQGGVAIRWILMAVAAFNSMSIRIDFEYTVYPPISGGGRSLN